MVLSAEARRLGDVTLGPAGPPGVRLVRSHWGTGPCNLEREGSQRGGFLSRLLLSPRLGSPPTSD